MKWIVTYDIADDDVRSRVAAILGRNGHRVQWSVFECRMEREEILVLASAIAHALTSSAGDVRFYRLCSACGSESFGLGQLTETPDSAPALII